VQTSEYKITLSDGTLLNFSDVGAYLVGEDLTLEGPEVQLHRVDVVGKCLKARNVLTLCSGPVLHES
jgi:hypothetical protein